MRKLLLLLTLFSGLALAQESSFEREFSRFDKDFERLNSWKAETPASKKLKRAPAAPVSPATPGQTATPTVTPLEDGAAHTTHEVARDLSPGSPKDPLEQKPQEMPKEVTPSGNAPEQPVIDEVLRKPARSTTTSTGLPKGAKMEKLTRQDLLGHQISDPDMRKKVQELYKRPDVVVQQYVLPTN